MRIVLSVIFVLVLVAGIIGLGAAVYQAGYTQGLAQSGQIEAPNTVVVPHPYYAPFWGPWGFGFGCFGVLLVFFAFFGLMRLLFGPRHWGWSGGWYGGPRGFDRDHVPPMAEEWHRKMHEKANEKANVQTTQV